MLPVSMRGRTDGGTVGPDGAGHQILSWLPRALALADAVVVAGTFGPWLRSGGRVRSSYEVAGALERLQVLEGWARPAVTVLWYFVPLLGALCVLGVAVGHVRVTALGSAVLATGTSSFAIALRRSAYTIEWGVLLTVGASIAALALAASTALATSTRPRLTRGTRPPAITHHPHVLKREQER